MTRKDYVAIAEALNQSRIDGHGLNSASLKYVREQWEEDRRRIADVLASDNPRFDRARFYSACEKASI